MTWHETWSAIKGKATTLVSIERLAGRRLTSDAVRAACKKLGIKGTLRHGRYEYTEAEAEALANILRREQCHSGS